MTEIIKFYKINEPFGCFSNFSKFPIDVNGNLWRTSEHFFQAQKSLDMDYRMAVLNTKTAHDVVKLGRGDSLNKRQDWYEIRDNVMRFIVWKKIQQHPTILEILMSTDNKTIIERADYDDYWGDGMDGKGENMLGKILMEIRDEIRTNGLSGAAVRYDSVYSE